MTSAASSNLDLYSPCMRVNPFPVYSRIRRNSPVCLLIQNGFWLISGYDNAIYALKNHNVFSSANNHKLVRPDLFTQEYEYIPQYPLVFDDPPRHTQLRQPLNKKLVGDVIGIGREEIVMRKAAASALAHIDGRKSVDFFADFIRPYVGSVVCHFIGIDDTHSLLELDNWLTPLELPPPRNPNKRYIERIKAANREKERFFKVRVHSHGERSRDNLIDTLLAAIGEDKLTAAESAKLLELLTLAGYQAPRHFLCHAIIQLAHNPGMFERLAKSPEEIPLFIEEVLRFSSPLHFLFRTSLCPVTLSGVTIPEGASVAINVADANRDPTYFPDPDTFDIDRKSGRKHIAFGYGVHNCLGAALARTLAKVMLETLVSHLNGITCPNNDELPWFYSLVVHGVENLPVELIH